MIKNIKLALLASLSIFIISCEGFLENSGSTIYDRPEWLAGKVYTQLLEQEGLSTFTECVERSGYDTIIDVSGSYTVFAPNNEAFIEFFAAHPAYNSVSDMPQEVVTELVKYHIVQNPWSKEQLRSLDIYGWIDSTDLQNNKPRGFKRETLLRKDDLRFGVDFERNRTYIIDPDEASLVRRVITDSRKYAPVFFSEYFDIYDLTSADYQFYFNRAFESNELYFAGAKIIGKEIFAENGFVYNVDKVVSPLKSAYELLSTEYNDYSYSEYLTLVNRFPSFNFNQETTNDQPGADEGATVDSLFDLSYSQLAFNIVYEGTAAPSAGLGGSSASSIRYHHGMVAPTNAALEKFTSEFLSGPTGWGELHSAPEHIQRIVVNSHMSKYPIYPSHFDGGFYNGENDLVSVSESDIIHKEFGSNCTFIGVDEAIVPRAFKSVTGPVYLQNGYSRAMYAIEETKLLSALKRNDAEYVLFVEADADLRQDSSLMYESFMDEDVFFAYQTAGATAQRYTFLTGDVRRLILNHVGTAVPEGVARKEFVKNLAGEFLVFNNETGEVRGTRPTTSGYQGNTQVPNIPTQISTNADNGITYRVDNWFSFGATSIEATVLQVSSDFHNLINKAGLYNTYEKYSFLSESEVYTVFAPSAEAIVAAGADTLEGQALKDFVRAHFIQGEVIFTDGKKAPGYYQTMRRDEKSTQFTTVYTQVYIAPGIDIIEFSGNDADTYLSVEEAVPVTNNLASRAMDLEDDEFNIPSLINYNIGVVHRIDKAFSVDEMDTK